MPIRVHNGGVDRREEQKAKNTMLTTQPAIWPAGGPKRAADKHLAHVAQHVIPHAGMAGRVHVGIDAGRRC